MNRTGVRRAASALAVVLGSNLALAGLPQLQDLWPHAAGAFWTYDRITATWTGGSPTFTAGNVRFEILAAEPQANGDTLQILAVEGAPNDPALLAQLRVARPDVDVPLNPTATSGVALHDAARLHIAADEIAAYDTQGSRTWVYLDVDATAGRTFRLQLLPALADSVFLTGRVVGTAGISTPAGSFADAVLVSYVVDFGWGAIPGQPADAVRAVTRGEMYFAPGVGPVLARETFVPAAQTRGTPPTALFDSTFTELQLLRHAQTEVQGTSWSAVKQRFR